MSQYHNGESCTNCSLPTKGKQCTKCGYPMCEICHKQNRGKCHYCKQEAATVMVGNMDNNYDYTDKYSK